VASSEARPTPQAIMALLPGFVAPSSRCRRGFPPSRSEGERAYDIARDGEEFELKARVVNIEAPDPGRDAGPGPHELEARMWQGGRYVRAMARDLGRLLGLLWPCGGAPTHRAWGSFTAPG